MILSIVTGTYNRLSYLMNMIASVRIQMHTGLAYEFVIVDGGSNDGTQDWCKQQTDVRLIEQGKLTGAIAAFGVGALAAQGDYVLLANDDVEFLPYGILSAIAYLDEHPNCGMVAFADDRPLPPYPNGYKVQLMQVQTENGLQSLPYGQVAMMRRWLGDLCGWWGHERAEFKGRTYGGDNYLSARIYEHGYTVDAVKGIQCKDLVVSDGLREKNSRTESNGKNGYYALYPHPPRQAPQPTVSNPQSETLRILYLPIFETNIYPHQRSMKRGLKEALQKVGQVVEVDYLNEAHDLNGLVAAWQPHILFTQCQTTKLDLQHARAICPNMLVLNWNGDVWAAGLTDEPTLSWLKRKNADVQLVVNASVLPIYAQHGIQAHYWQCAYEPVDIASLPEVPAFDVVFLGSAYSPKRHALADVLERLPYKTGLIGSGWANRRDNTHFNTTYNFPLSYALRANAKIEVGDNQYPTDTGFVSDRMFNALYAGVCLLHQRIEALEDYTGIQAGVHYVEWTDFEDLQAKIHYYMLHDEERITIAQAGQAFILANHSFDHRIKQLFKEILA